MFVYRLDRKTSAGKLFSSLHHVMQELEKRRPMLMFSTSNTDEGMASDALT